MTKVTSCMTEISEKLCTQKRLPPRIQSPTLLALIEATIERKLTSRVEIEFFFLLLTLRGKKF